MIELLMILSLSQLNTQPNALAQSQPCVWPNTCRQQAIASKPFTTCQMPNKCAKPAIQLAQFKPCVWPNTCRGNTEAAL